MTKKNNSIQYSQKLLSKIIDAKFKGNFEKLLIQKSADKCFLCKKNFNYAKDIIQVDHDIPESQGGSTDYKNLNLVHESCNKFKRDYSSLLVSKYLPFKIFIEENPNSKFDHVTVDFFKIKPQPIVTLLSGKGYLKLQFSNGSETDDLPIYYEQKPDGRVYKYVFAQVPASSIFNDKVQPRPMKPAHVFKIFQDLHLNPLHEPSSVRLECELDNGSSNKLLMFDGQHKTVAKMLVSDLANSKIDLKIYLDLTLKEATALVNTIQSKIIKLGLTKSEFAAKMGDEFNNEFLRYSDYCVNNDKEISEDGFINFTEKSRQANNKKTLIQSRINTVINQSQDDLRILNIVEGKSDLVDKKSIIKETTFINKLIIPFVYNKPLKYPIGNDERRNLEVANIHLILNLFYDICLAYDPNNVSQLELNKIHKIKSQSVLNLFVDLIKDCYNFWFVKNNDAEILTRETLLDKKEKLSQAIQLFFDHPIWIQDEKKSKKIADFNNILQKNGSLIDLADKMNLNAAYLVGIKELKGDEFDS